ncbi:MAG: TolC family protein [Fimbriimonadales bacterium]|nr:TolC family protein [Fimbriimonadales bacterium]
MRRKLVISWVLISSGLYGQTAPPCFTVEQALQRAIEANGALRALRQDWLAAALQVKAARAPQALFLHWTPALTPGGTGEELIIAQMLELNGARAARERTARAEQQLAHAQILKEANQLLSETARAFYHALYAERLRQLAEAEVQRAEQTLALIRQQVEIGVRPGLDQIQAEIELERVRQTLSARTVEAHTAQATLNRWLGLEPSARVNLEEPRTPSPPKPPGAWSSHPDWLHQQARWRSMQALRRQTQIEGLPDVGVQMRLEKHAQPGFGLIFSLPFVDYGARRKRLQALETATAAEALRLQTTQHALQTELANAHLQAQNAYQRWEAYQRDILPRAQKLLQSAQVGLESGHLSILQVLEAQRTARQIQEEALLAERAYWIAITDYAEKQADFAALWRRQHEEGTRNE